MAVIITVSIIKKTSIMSIGHKSKLLNNFYEGLEYVLNNNNDNLTK